MILKPGRSGLGAFQILVFALILSCTGCHNFYKATTIKSYNPAKSIDLLRQKEKVFVLRNGNESFLMKDIRSSENGAAISCNLEPLPENHKMYLTHARKGKQQYYINKDTTVTKEVHLFLNPTDSLTYGPAEFPYGNIQSIRLIERDQKRSGKSYILGGVAYTMSAFAIIIVIIVTSLGK